MRPHVTVSTEGRLSTARKLALAAEILGTYAVVTWRFPRLNLMTLAAQRQARDMPAETHSADAEAVARRLARATMGTLRLMPNRPTCLPQSLVLSELLAARGIASKLVIGAHSDPEFLAHAWVEYAGQPLLPTYGFRDSALIEI